LLTFLSALFIPLQYAIFLGAGLSLLLYVYASSKDVRVFQLVRDETGEWKRIEMPKTYPANKITVVFFEGIHFFAEIPSAKELVPMAQGSTNAVVIWPVQSDMHTSSTMLKWLQGYIRDMQAGGNVLILADVPESSMQILDRTRLLDLIGRENVFPAEDDLEGALIKAWQAAQTALAAQGNDNSGSANA
jgi:SulP family sulfate permease